MDVRPPKYREAGLSGVIYIGDELAKISADCDF